MIITLEFEGPNEERQAHTISEQLNDIYPHFVINVAKMNRDGEIWEE